MGKFPDTVAVVGLGYVGLPLAVAFGRTLPTLGFDINTERVAELRQGRDRNHELTSQDLTQSRHLVFTDSLKELVAADVFVVSVPTPVDKAKRPDLSHLRSASRLVGEALKERAGARRGAAPAVVVYESTVYPGCTEEVCVPILEEASGLTCGSGFKVGYSPERINPGDKEHTLERVIKVVAGQDAETLRVVADLYGRVVTAGLYAAPDIRTAEAAKVIENTQRDLNIALMNELSILFHRLGLDTREVLKAARTKWNFLPFEPGLVGGHCIPEDPYYLTHKAAEAGHHPEVILAGRRINDQMGNYVAQEVVRLLIRAGKAVQGAHVLVLGVAFKENVPDVRNTRVVDLVRELERYGVEVTAHDPHVAPAVLQKLGLKATGGAPFGEPARFDAVVLAVPHKEFRARPVEEYLAIARGLPIVVDVRGTMPRAAVEGAGALYWSL